jgi:ATP-binding cassette subfamily C protein
MKASPVAKSALLSRAIQPLRREIWTVGLFSAAINLLMLTGSLYMLQVYDRVLSSRSVPTLIALSLLALGAFALQGVLEAMRGKLLSRLAAQVDEIVSPTAMRAASVLPLHGASGAEALQPQRDADSIRAFVASAGPTALLDLPFMPIFLIGCFLLHPWLGWAAVSGGAVIIGLTLLVDRKAKAPTQAATASAAEHHALLDSIRRNAALIQALGMRPDMNRRSERIHERMVDGGLAVSDATGGVGAAARVARLGLQSAVLGLGAYLAIQGLISAGGIIAASILTSRALAPIEVAVAHWRGFVGARQGWERLSRTLTLLEPAVAPSPLPAPRRDVVVTGLSLAAPGTRSFIVRDVSFTLKAGQALALIGPSGAGKSTLARALAGVEGLQQGSIALDGAAWQQWDPETRGRHVGYLPQDVELFDGTIADNIARFAENRDMASVLRAAELANAHDMILSLPQGYDTQVGDGGGRLSGGQRQRVALARALFGDPFLIILDEPNAHLDQEGDEALSRAVQSVKARGAIVIMVTHRPAALTHIDLVGVMEAGKLRTMGPKEQILRELMQRRIPKAVSAAAPDRPAPPQASRA